MYIGSILAFGAAFLSLTSATPIHCFNKWRLPPPFCRLNTPSVQASDAWFLLPPTLPSSSHSKTTSAPSSTLSSPWTTGASSESASSTKHKGWVWGAKASSSTHGSHATKTSKVRTITVTRTRYLTVSKTKSRSHITPGPTSTPSS
ncbi:hypothetical protein GQ44DRAFT_721837 [Phaeosphaeriaceae sp. PMI808]|nr:hypothetical protein GQ44DRAFT_721837 [Phaeosphaeriaceae sp. PMI808]